MTPPRQAGHAVPGPTDGALTGLRWWPFLILAGGGAAVFVSGGRQGPATGPLTMVWALTLTKGFALAVFLELMARAWVNRQRLAAGFDASPEAAQAGHLGGLEGWNGFIYSNAKDPRLWVPKLSGFGATRNFAHVRAWLILGAILAFPLTGVAFALVSAFCR